MTYETHVLDIVNSGSWTDKTFNSVSKYLKSVERRLSGPESTLLLRSIHDKRCFLSANIPDKTSNEIIYGPVSHRPTERTDDFSIFKLVLKDYVNHNIKKTLNMTIKEYLALTPYEKIIYDEFALECTEAIAKVEEKLEKDTNENVKNFKESISSDMFDED